MPHVCAETLIEQSRPEGSSALQGDTNRSAFTPYKSSTVLTNLQRGNVPTQTQAVPLRRCIHQLSAQGEISPDQITPERLDLRDEAGLTPLLWASSHGQLSTVRHLVAKGAQVDAQGLKGETALMLAAGRGHSHIVRHLLLHGASPNQADREGNTALMYAAVGNYAAAAQELLSSGADMSAQNSVCDTAYDLSVSMSAQQVQQVLDNYILKLLQ
ncbi:ankyrin repeat family A protein 2-like isoform X2 [Dermacentor silvarum]|uniref:ankyrin repeat family A protein 2-like isoform X2 n=1 Tax=Dermacentor silvarum TaxID=543639 RepID=UPI001898F6C3|nr:ankyrin repeat family A protein 2-like isoform X2 [Dermacentor silvarum]